MPDQTQTLLALPVLPLKNVVLFPKLVLPLSVGREASRAAVDAAIRDHEGEMILVAQKDSGTAPRSAKFCALHPTRWKSSYRAWSGWSSNATRWGIS